MLTVVYVVVAVIVVVLILAAAKPDVFKVERSTDIKAAPDKIFALIDDFHHWAAWSPWEKLDPAMMRSFSGPASGKGAAYAWEGNKKVGKGAMEITDLTVPEKIVIKLDFFIPFEAHNTTVFTLTRNGEITSVNWLMSGPASFMVKIMHVFMNMDKMVGKDFAAGLANLKAVAEK
ncbi:MAG TPA: SRPBCC family protein [Burkholderiaceae bacterium]|jgi:uncharacterized protein YndB with AHSA1/START domain